MNGRKRIVINTTNTKENIEQKEKRKGNQFLEELNLRDYFAAKAMQALLPTNYIDANAVLAYRVADAMLRAREQ
jgi:hypothetical protein